MSRRIRAAPAWFSLAGHNTRKSLIIRISSLQDFFTHKILICGFTPSKTFRLAKLAYGDQYTDEELVRWLTSYCRRLFSQQFKRSCLMDGPAVEAFSVSPRSGFLLPSDAENALFLRDLEELQK